MSTMSYREGMDTDTLTLTTTDFDRVADDDRYLGWGYIGEREMKRLGHIDPSGGITAAKADAVVLAIAAERGWTYEDFFAWCNSKLGRWYGDTAFGMCLRTAAEVRERAEAQGLFDIGDLDR